VASLREIKDRIGSVRSTLKITSAMKLVASAKLRKAQRAIEALRPYERTLAEIYNLTNPAAAEASPTGNIGAANTAATAVVAIASNSSLCGGFNANVVRKTLETIRGCEGAVEVYPLGRKMTEALRRAGYTADQDYNDLVGHPSYEQSAALARRLAERYERGEIARVVLVYTSFVSASRQEPVAETYLPFSASFADSADRHSPTPIGESPDEEYLLEPDAAALAAQLLPQVMLLKFHAAILDSAAAEQAARTLAMQTATDNAEDLLGELTLEYNKGRQQKITAEILDLLGGAAQ
jgi:F-type H+-transporting ATPase subunit gamma